MDKQEAKQTILEYIRKYNLNFKLLNDSGDEPVVPSTPMPITELDTFYLSYKINTPDNLLESDIHLGEENMLVRAYYGAAITEVARNADKKTTAELLTVLNFVNERVFGGYHIPCYPLVYLSNDGFGNIGIKTRIDYRIFELLPEETMNFITIFFPQIMEELAYPIIAVITGELTAAKAIQYIKQEIMGEGEQP